mgnify:FL=1
MIVYIVISIIVFLVICSCLSSIISLSCSTCYKPNEDGVLYLPSTVFDGDLVVNGSTYLTKDATVEGNMDVSGDLLVENNLSVVGESRFGNTTTKGLVVESTETNPYVVNYGDENNRKIFTTTQDGKIAIYNRNQDGTKSSLVWSQP